VLIVDDDRPLMMLSEEMMTALGYEPVRVDNSPLALAAFKADPARFDLVLADEIMPELTGPSWLDISYGPNCQWSSSQVQACRLHRPLRGTGIREILNKPL
jgi:DNA-binding NtrC family response regulator